MQQLTLVYMITYYTALCNGKGRGWKEIAELYNSGKKALYMIITYKVSSVLGDNPHLYLVVGKVGVFNAWQLVRLSTETERHRPIYHLWKTSHDIRGPMKSCTISHCQSQPVRRIDISTSCTISHNRHKKYWCTHQSYGPKKFPREHYCFHKQKVSFFKCLKTMNSKCLLFTQYVCLWFVKKWLNLEVSRKMKWRYNY